MFLNTKCPAYVSAVFNPIVFEFTKSDYQVGDLFYLEVFDGNNQSIITLPKNGTGSGAVSFDISTILQTLFSKPYIPDLNSKFQLDETALKYYSVKAGTIEIKGNQQIKTPLFSANQFCVIRAALPKDNSEVITASTVDYLIEAKFLTEISSLQSQGSDLILPALFLSSTTVKLVLQADNTTIEEVFEITSAGVYLFNVKPVLYGLSVNKFSVWLESETPNYYSTMGHTQICSTGYTGYYSAVTTAFSSFTKDAAMGQAITDAEALAMANITCKVIEHIPEVPVDPQQ